MKITLTILIAMAVWTPIHAQQTLLYQLNTKMYTNYNNAKFTIYFGEGSEELSHFTLHMLIAIRWPKVSLIAAIAIETADTMNGRFDERDWGARLVGVFVGFMFNQYLFK